jgi:hypothetical protein
LPPPRPAFSDGVSTITVFSRALSRPTSAGRFAERVTSTLTASAGSPSRSRRSRASALLIVRP